MAAKKTALSWETKNVRAKNLRVGDRMEFLNRKTMRAVAFPIRLVTIDDRNVQVAFGGRMKGWATLFRDWESVRIKRKKS